MAFIRYGEKVPASREGCVGLEITEADRQRFYSHVVATDQCWIWVGDRHTTLPRHRELNDHAVNNIYKQIGMK